MDGESHSPAPSPPKVAGTVRLMTEEPAELPSVSLLGHITRQLDERPWLVPVALAGLVAVVMVRRHRS